MMNRSRAARIDDLAADRARALKLTPVSRETAQRLDRFVALLLQWQNTTNLVGPSTLPHLWTRHIADSLQLLALVPDALTWIDLGSGAGFPGLVVACALAERPGGRVQLVESNLKKVAFLREAIRVTGAPAVVHGERIEDFVRRIQDRPDVVTARALAPLDVVLGWVQPLLKKGAQALLLKGQYIEGELTKASKYWIINATQAPSKTSREGRILVVRSLERRAGVSPATGSGWDDQNVRDEHG